MSAVTEVRALTRGSGAALTALLSGSMVLAGRGCRCASRALSWAWDQASVDAPATAAAQTKADKAAQAAKARANKSKKANTDEQDENGQEDPEEVKALPVKAVRRPALESLAMLALGGVMAAGAVATLGTVAWPYLQQLAPWRGLIAGVGGLAWMVAAWMVAPPPAEDEHQDDGQEHEDVEHEDGGLSPGDLLGRHVLAELAELEKQGRPGLHVTALITSAEEAGLLAADAMDKTAMRAWLEATGLPVTKSVKVAGEVDYGVRIDRVREALGMGPTEALERAFGGAPASTTPAAPVEAPVTPVVAPAQAPCLTLLKPLPDGGSQDAAQGAA
ncbi:hypothetical protein RM550_07310 [Streptomyces sp. DSM 41527]|uniref:Uncharacterized protein n=1 Tax=Streptomyces mooreae TaxID=3075523 RepID=A0ABU2T2U3_9ACTN|nr:hypothetical protein [Streptomyces sp. DSM 41527]MDT0455546.1 hypothetical protein [Streptomyces sp. DSM 41527]